MGERPKVGRSLDDLHSKGLTPATPTLTPATRPD
jgi:hypothetical protein